MEYKGYIARIKLDCKADVFHGEVLNPDDAVTSFQGKSLDEIHESFTEAVDHYLRIGDGTWDEGEPFSGRITLRLWPELHSRIIKAAKSSGKEVEDWIAEVLDRAAGT